MLLEARCPFKGRRVRSKAIQRPPGRARLTLAISSSCTFQVLTSEAYLEVFLNLDWGDLGVPRNLWMLEIYGCLVFRKLKKLKFQQLDQKLWPWESLLMRFSQFSLYLNSFWNKNWIIFIMAVVSTRFGRRIKIKVFGPTQDQLQVKLGQSS